MALKAAAAIKGSILIFTAVIIMYCCIALLATLCLLHSALTLPVAPAVAADCKVFYTGQCPGDDSCLCTLDEPCSASSLPCVRNASSPTTNCGGACRKVAHGLCPGGSSCLADVGECDSPPSYAWGPDVSDYQGSVDWAAVKAAGASFAFTKATEGLSFTCQTFAPNWQGMRSAGIGFRCRIHMFRIQTALVMFCACYVLLLILHLRGAYHFGHPGEDPTAQAQFFVQTVGALGDGEVLVLDIEVASSNTSLRSTQDVASWSKDFVDAVCSLANIPPSRVLIYTGAWFWYMFFAGCQFVAGADTASGTLRREAAACAPTILSGLAATRRHPLCQVAGLTGRSGSTPTRLKFQASAVAWIAPTSAAVMEIYTHG